MRPRRACLEQHEVCVCYSVVHCRVCWSPCETLPWWPATERCLPKWPVTAQQLLWWQLPHGMIANVTKQGRLEKSPCPKQRPIHLKISKQAYIGAVICTKSAVRSIFDNGNEGQIPCILTLLCPIHAYSVRPNGLQGTVISRTGYPRDFWCRHISRVSQTPRKPATDGNVPKR